MLTVSTAMIRTVENVEKYKVIICIVSMTLAFYLFIQHLLSALFTNQYAANIYIYIFFIIIFISCAAYNTINNDNKIQYKLNHVTINCKCIYHN